MSSDHSIITCNFKGNNCPRGPGFWKMNSRFLQTDSDFINHIKEKILELKEIHENTSCNLNILWEAFNSNVLFQVIVWNIWPEKRKKEMPPSLSL